MSERKVLNKYFPPDFDPAKIPRLKLAKDRQYVVRLMAPCNMKCTTCSEYIYKGKKFNARKETVQDEEYCGIRIFRFYIRCPRCLAEITFKTNPKEADYDLEHGATRNFQALQTAEKLAEAQRVAEEEDDKANPMKMLEKRTAQSLLEMEKIEALEELKELNERQATVDFEGMLSKNLQQQKETAEQRQQREEDEIRAEAEAIFKQRGIEKVDGVRVKRVKDVDSDEEEQRLKKVLKSDDPLGGQPRTSSSQLSRLKGLARVNDRRTFRPRRVCVIFVGVFSAMLVSFNNTQFATLLMLFIFIYIYKSFLFHKKETPQTPSLVDLFVFVCVCLPLRMSVFPSESKIQQLSNNVSTKGSSQEPRISRSVCRLAQS